MFSCEVSNCKKICKSSAGLKRHVQCIHPEVYIQAMEVKLYARLDPSKLLELLTTTKTKLSQKSFPENYRELFDKLTFTKDEAKLLLQMLKDPVMQFNGDIEKFYIKFHQFSSSNTPLPQKIRRIPTNIFSQSFKL